MTNIAQKLTDNFHFDEKEARVYLAALSLGRSKASEIGKKSGLNRITAYEILKRLALRGFASVLNYEKTKYFQVINPDRLIEKLERQTSLARESLPELLLIKNADKQKPKVEYYEGQEGVRLIYEDTLDCSDKVIYNIANPQNLLPFISDEFISSYIKRRLRRKIEVKALLPETLENKSYINKQKSELREVKFFDSKKFPIPNEIMIYGNKVALLSFSGQIGVIIEDKEIAQSLKSIWQLLWEKAGSK